MTPAGGVVESPPAVRQWLRGRRSWQPHEYAVEFGVGREEALEAGRRLAATGEWREDVLYYHCGPDAPPCRTGRQGQQFRYPFHCGVCDEPVESREDLRTDVIFVRVRAGR